MDSKNPGRLLLLAKDFYEVFARENAQDTQVEVQRAKSYIRLAKLTEDLGEANGAIPLSQQAYVIFDNSRGATPTCPSIAKASPRGSIPWRAITRQQISRRRRRTPSRKRSRPGIGCRGISPDEGSYLYHTAVTLNRMGRLLCLVLRDLPGCERALTRSWALRSLGGGTCPIPRIPQ